MNKYNFKEFKGIYWDHDEIKDEWVLADSPNIEIASLAHFNASVYGIHEAFEAFKEFLKESQKLNVIDAFANRTRVQPPLIKLKLDTDGKTRTIGSGTKKSKYKGTKLKNKKFR